MPSFGYTAGMGSGDAAYSGALTASYYVNTTGAVVYVDTVTLLNVKSALSIHLKAAIYSDAGSENLGLSPFALLASTGSVASLSVGSNVLAIVGDPLAVGPGQGVWVAIIGDNGAVVFTNAATSGLEAVREGSINFGTGFPSQFAPDTPKLHLIVPATLSGSATGPGHATDIRVPLMVSEALADGVPAVRATLLLSEPLTEGSPALRASLLLSEPLSEGDDHLRCPLVCLESLHPIPTEGEMITARFPTQLGMALTAHKTPTYVTQVRTAANLKTTRNSLTPWPAWDFQVDLDYLPTDAPFMSGTSSPDFSVICGFFKKMKGKFGAFLFRDPQAHQVTNGSQATGDGVTLQFPFMRMDDGEPDPVGQVDTGAGWTIYVDGVAQVEGSGISFVAPNQYAFDVAPADAAVITGTFTYDFVCHFLQDAADFEQFNRDLFQLQQVQFRADPAL